MITAGEMKIKSVAFDIQAESHRIFNRKPTADAITCLLESV